MIAPEVHTIASDLVLASRGVDRVSLGGRAMLLERAAGMLSRLLGPEDIRQVSFVTRLRALAANVEDYPAGAIGAAMSDAAHELMKASALAGAEPEGRA